MSKELVARIRSNRQGKVEVGKFTFQFRRPTDLEAFDLSRSKASWAQIALEFVTGWENVTEDDVVGGGGSDKVAFDPLLWREWCADREDFWEPIANRVLESYGEHFDAQKAAVKNS